VPPPPDLLAQVTLEPLPSLVERIGRLGRNAGWWRVPAGEPWQLVRTLFGLASGLESHVDWDWPLHVLLVAGPPGGPLLQPVWVIPLRSWPETRRALADRCGPPQRGAGDVLRLPGDGFPCGLALRPTARGALVAAEERALHAVGGYGRQVAVLRGLAASSIEARVFPRNLLARLGLGDGKLAQSAQSAGLLAGLALGDLAAGQKVGAVVERLLAHLGSAVDLGLGLDVGEQALGLRLFATAGPSGALRDYLSQRAPDRPELDRFPALPGPVVLAVAGDSRATSRSALAGLLDLALQRLPLPLRGPVQALLEPIQRPPDGAVGVALCRGPEPAGGRCLLAVTHPAQARRALAALRSALAGLLPVLGQVSGPPGGAPSRGGSRYRFAVDLPAPSGGGAALLRHLAGGPTLDVILAADGGRVVLGLGACAELAVAGALTRGPAAAPARSLASAVADRPGRLGLVRLSLTELGRWLGLEAAGPGEPGEALLLHWGITRTRGQVDATAELPYRHLAAALALLEPLLAAPGPPGGPLGALLNEGEPPEDAL
jgi:hypothetical protein